MLLEFDPCALPCRIGQRHGALPIAHDAGAIHDCVEHLEPVGGCGTGFLFKHFDANGILWAIDQAMAFNRQPHALRSSQVRRIMTEGLERFEAADSAHQMIALYARVLDRSLALLGMDVTLSPRSQMAA